ncbi:lysylphosphatidylglycerol synthase domain-containing protein [Aquipuribacter sp. SD81]|uniref:lysylphosphatidylglycerol synthase domain-containing protein n=1 Tax=Aquipuribacter sp. SD81 TaxID=3127703 RepID=UPI00301A4A87
MRAAAPVPGASRRPRLLWPAVRLGATVAVLGTVAAVVGGDAVRAGAAVLAPGPVLAALGLGALWRALASLRWLVVSRALGAALRPADAYAEYARSELLNAVVPGGVVGDVDRARRHARGVGRLTAARAVVVERGLGQVTLLTATGGALALDPRLLGVTAGVDRRTVGVAVVLVLVLGAVVLAVWQPWRARPARPAHGVAGDRGRLAAALGLGLVASAGVLACFVATFLLAAAVTGLDAPATQVVPAVLVTLVVSAVPLTVSGWGAREAGAALAFAAVGVGAADGVAASVGYGLLALVAALPGLLPLALAHRREVEVEAHVVTEPEVP